MDNFSVSGGVNSFVYDLCYAIKERGNDVSLIGVLSKGYEENTEIEKLREKGIRVECIAAASKKDAIMHYIGKLKAVIKDISGNDFTVCNLHLKLSVLMGVLATRGLSNVKCVETYHNTYHRYHLQCWVCSPFIKKYICVSETAMEEMHNRFKIPYKKLIAIPNGVSRKRIREIANIENYMHKDEQINFVSVGRLSYEKNFTVAVKAFVEMCNNKNTYTLVGDGPQEKEIQTIARNNPYIKMTGSLSRERTLQELAKADIVVMPSLWEGRSILQLEAMALDKPMILSDVPGLREPFEEKPLLDCEKVRVCQFGYLVKTDDPEAYRNAAKHFSRNLDRIKNVSNYIESVSNKNDITTVAEKYCCVYSEVERKH